MFILPNDWLRVVMYMLIFYKPFDENDNSWLPSFNEILKVRMEGRPYWNIAAFKK